MNKQNKNNDFIYAQGLANLKLEGMALSKDQEQIARNYHSGQLSHDELIQEALKYARSR